MSSYPSINESLLELAQGSESLENKSMVSIVDTDELILYNDNGASAEIYVDPNKPDICYKIGRPSEAYLTEDKRNRETANRLREIATCAELSDSGITPNFHGVVVTPDGRMGYAMEFYKTLKLLPHMEPNELKAWEKRVQDFERFVVSQGLFVLGDMELAAVSDSPSLHPETSRLVLIDLTSLHKLSDAEDQNAAIARNHQTFSIHVYDKLN